MIYRRTYLLIILLFLISSTAIAQTAKFSWVGDICSSVGTYKLSVYTEYQIQDTYRITMTRDFELNTGSIPPFSLVELNRENVVDLDREYERKLADLNKLDLIKTTYWQDLKVRKIEYLKQYYQLKRATMLAYSDPSALNKIAKSDPVLLKYAQALNSGDEQLINTWKEVNEASRLKNGLPGRLKQRFDQQNSSADRYKYATMEVLAFGWWNHAIRSLNHVDTSQAQENFIKLFRRMKDFDCNL